MAIAAPVEFRVQNVKATSGAIYINMFDSAQAWDDQQPTSVLTIAKVVKGMTTMTADLAPGEYAFFAYHDVDGNGELKQNPFGMPVEPYAFSNNFKLEFSKPPFAKLKFKVDDAGTVHSVSLVH
jgi:uncharacterized protein (DUF2141 family)